MLYSDINKKNLKKTVQKIYLYDILFLVNNCQKKEQLSQKEIKTLLLMYGKILVTKSFTIYINKRTKSLY